MSDVHHLMSECNGCGRFTASQASALVKFSEHEFLQGGIWRRLHHEIAKQMLWELHLLFDGKLVDSDGDTHGLHARLSAAQREEAREAFRILWSVIEGAKLEHSPLAKAHQDDPFQRFMQRASKRDDGPVGPLRRRLRAARRSEAAKRVWARRKRPAA